jgi:hypothetical protein
MKAFLVVTSIAGADNPVLKQLSEEAKQHKHSVYCDRRHKKPRQF